MADDPWTPENEAQVAEEKVTSFELGYKATLAGRLRLNTAAYYYTYDDMQVQMQVLRQGIAFEELFSVHKAEAYGLELEALWVLGPNTTFTGSYAYSHTEMTDFCGDKAELGAGGTVGCMDNWYLPDGYAYDPTGNRLPETPKHTFAANISQNVHLDNGALLNFNATYAFVDEMYYGVIYDPPVNLTDSYGRWDFRVSWKSATKCWAVYGYLKNAFDELSAIGLGDGGPPYYDQWATYGMPRSYGVEIHFNY